MCRESPSLCANSVLSISCADMSSMSWDFQVNMISAAKRDMSATRVLQGSDKMGDSLSILKSLLSSDKDNQDLIDLTFDRRKLSHEMKHIIRKDMLHM